MKKKFLKISLFISLMVVGIQNAFASSLSLSASSTTIKKGGSVTLNINGSDVVGRFDISTSNASVVSTSTSYVWVENDTQSITLSGLNAGSSTITVKPNGKISDLNGNNVDLSVKSITINVNSSNPSTSGGNNGNSNNSSNTPVREKSNDNTLKSLTVDGYELTPEFNKDVQAYQVSVPEGTKNVTVKGVANDSYATVTGDGEIELDEGVNAVNIVVKSEVGVEKIYTVSIEAKDSNPLEVKVKGEAFTIVKTATNLEKPDNFDESTIIIDEIEVPAFINKKADLTLVGLKDSNGNIDLYVYDGGSYTLYRELKLNKSLIPVDFDEKLDLEETTISINDEDVKGYKFTDSGDYVIIRAMDLESGKKDLYLYDVRSKTAVKYDEELNKAVIDNETVHDYTYIIIIFAGVAVLFLIVIFVLMHSLKKKQRKMNKFIEKQEAKIEATWKLNDVIDEVQKRIGEEGEESKNSEEEINKNKVKKDKLKDDKIEVKKVDVDTQEKQQVSEDTEEIYDIFEDDKKKKKKKKK